MFRKNKTTLAMIRGPVTHQIATVSLDGRLAARQNTALLQLAMRVILF